MEQLRALLTREAANIKHHTPGSVGINYEAVNAILQLTNAFSAQQQETANMCGVQKTSEQSLRIQVPQIQIR